METIIKIYILISHIPTIRLSFGTRSELVLIEFELQSLPTEQVLLP